MQQLLEKKQQRQKTNRPFSFFYHPTDIVSFLQYLMLLLICSYFCFFIEANQCLSAIRYAVTSPTAVERGSHKAESLLQVVI